MLASTLIAEGRGEGGCGFESLPVHIKTYCLVVKGRFFKSEVAGSNPSQCKSIKVLLGQACGFESLSVHLKTYGSVFKGRFY